MHSTVEVVNVPFSSPLNLTLLMLVSLDAFKRYIQQDFVHVKINDSPQLRIY